MIQFFANIVAVVVVGLIVLRRGRDRRVKGVKSARWLRVAGLIPLAFPVALYLLFGFGEMASGDLSGAMHLPEAIVLVLLGILAWLRPLEGGIGLIAGGGLFAIVFMVGAIASGRPPGSAAPSATILIAAVPEILSGVLFLISGILARCSPTPGADQSAPHPPS